MRSRFWERITPPIIITWWVVGCFLFTVIDGIYLGATTSGGEQAQLELLGKMISVTIYGVLALGIITLPFYLRWYRERWYFALLIIGLSIAIIIEYQFEETTDFNQNTLQVDVNGNIYDETIQYYGPGMTNIRSISFLLDGRKDSVWTTYSRDGKIIAEKRYKDGVFVGK